MHRIGIAAEWFGLTRLTWTSLSTGVALTAVSRVAQTFALSHSRGFAFCVIGIVAGVAATLAVLLAFLSWRTRTTDDVGPLVTIVMVSAVGLGLIVEAFAGTSALLQRIGVAETIRTPTLWDSERYYLWHLTNAVPFLRIPQSLGWMDLGLYQGRASGVLLLLFKVAVISPLLRIAFVSVSLSNALDSRWMARMALLPREEAGPGETEPADRPLSPWNDTILAVLTVVIGFFLYIEFCQPGRAPHERLIRYVGREGGTIGAAVISVALGIACLRLASVRDAQVARLSSVAALTVRALTIGPAAILIASATLTGLAVAGYAQISPIGQSPDNVLTALATVAWHILAAPGSGVPDIVGWKLNHDFIGRPSAIVIMLAVLVFYALPVIVIARINNRYRQMTVKGIQRLTDVLSYSSDALASLTGAHEWLDQQEAAVEGYRSTEIVDSAAKRIHSVARKMVRRLEIVAINRRFTHMHLSVPAILNMKSEFVSAAVDASLKSRHRFERIKMARLRALDNRPVDQDRLALAREEEVIALNTLAALVEAAWDDAIVQYKSQRIV